MKFSTNTSICLTYLKGGKQTDLDGHDDIVELKNREEALIAAEARFTELNGRIEVGLVKMDRMFALMEQLVKPMQSVKQEPKIGSTPILNLSPNRPEIKRTLYFSTNKKPPPPPPLPDNEILGLVKEKFAKESIIRTANSTVQLSTTNGEFFVAKFMDYLESLGLKQAVLATRSQCIDPKNNKETEKVNKSRINILRTHKKAPWAEAHLQLKSLLTTEMYKELVINKDKEGTQDFSLTCGTFAYKKQRRRRQTKTKAKMKRKFRWVNHTMKIMVKKKPNWQTQYM